MSNDQHQINLQHKQSSPWWRHRWPWILMAGPFIAALACGFTIWLAFTKVDPPIREGVVQRGLKVTITDDAKLTKPQAGVHP